MGATPARFGGSHPWPARRLRASLRAWELRSKRSSWLSSRTIRQSRRAGNACSGPSRISGSRVPRSGGVKECRLAEKLRRDVAIVDMHLADGNGIRLTQELIDRKLARS